MKQAEKETKIITSSSKKQEKNIMRQAYIMKHFSAHSLQQKFTV